MYANLSMSFLKTFWSRIYANLLGVLLMEEILHRRRHIWQYTMTCTPAPPFQCCVLKHYAPVQDFSHSTSLFWGHFFETNVKWGARGSRLQVCLVVQDFFHQPYVRRYVIRKSVKRFVRKNVKRYVRKMAERMSEDMSERMSEDMSGRMS